MERFHNLLLGLCESFGNKHGLTPRQIDTLYVLANGVTSNAAVSKELEIALDTARNHLKSIYKRCKVSSKHEVLALLLKESLR